MIRFKDPKDIAFPVVKRKVKENSRVISTSIRLSVDEYLTLKKQARKAHLNIADYMRQRLGFERSNYPLEEE